MLLLQVNENPLKLRQFLTQFHPNELCQFIKFQYLAVLNSLCLTFNKMASLPQGAFAACKLREQFNEQSMILSRMKTSGADKNTTDNQKQHEYTLAKYNDKLMNSIWGLYNRYSPHNVKKNEYDPKKY